MLKAADVTRILGELGKVTSGATAEIARASGKPCIRVRRGRHVFEIDETDGDGVLRDVATIETIAKQLAQAEPELA